VIPLATTRHLVGLTGGIGSGKSTVAGMLVAKGCDLVDADQIARRITLPGGAALAPIASAFGSHMLNANGELNRDALRELVFKDANARKQLDSITHPLVAVGIANAVARSNAPVVVLDIPLLVESNKWRHALDQVIVVDCSPATQTARVKARNGWSDETISAVLHAQCRREIRLMAADQVICNEGITLEQLSDQVRALANRLGL